MVDRWGVTGVLWKFRAQCCITGFVAQFKAVAGISGRVRSLLTAVHGCVLLSGGVGVVAVFCSLSCSWDDGEHGFVERVLLEKLA